MSETLVNRDTNVEQQGAQQQTAGTGDPSFEFSNEEFKEALSWAKSHLDDLLNSDSVKDMLSDLGWSNGGTHDQATRLAGVDERHSGARINDISHVGDKTGADGGRVGSDVATVIEPNRTTRNPIPSRDYPAEAPAEEQIELAVDAFNEFTTEGSDFNGVNDLSGISETARQSAAAIMSGNYQTLQTALKDLENDPNGQDKLRELAQDLTTALGTTVTAQIKDGKFGLDFLTDFDKATRGGISGMTREEESHLSISSDGEMSAYSQQNPRDSRDFMASDTKEDLDAAREALRLQALAVGQTLEARDIALHQMSPLQFIPHARDVMQSPKGSPSDASSHALDEIRRESDQTGPQSK